jgi:hypothetical protein
MLILIWVQQSICLKILKITVCLEKKTWLVLFAVLAFYQDINWKIMKGAEKVNRKSGTLVQRQVSNADD